jgi:hypothetical protein
MCPQFQVEAKGKIEGIDFFKGGIGIFNSRYFRGWYYKHIMKTNGTPLTLQLNLASPRFWALGLMAGIFLVLALGLTGCHAASVAPAAPDITGAYTLVSVDGKPLPCVISHENAEIHVKSGVFTIKADGTCRSESVFAVSGYPDTKRVVEADYTLSGTNLTMRWKGAGTTTGTADGKAFSMNNEGMIFAYSK